jgi:hypothetical protein
MSAMTLATEEINSQNYYYELPGLGSTIATLTSSNAGNNINSNSYIATLGNVLGIPIPASSSATILGQVGGQAKLLSDDEVANIRAAYGPNFDTVPAGAINPYTLLPQGSAPVCNEVGTLTNGVVTRIGLGSLSGTVTIAYSNQPDGEHITYQASNGATADLSPSDQQSLASAGNIGAYIGAQLSQLIANNSGFASLATSTFFSTTGSLLGQEIAARNVGEADPVSVGECQGSCRSYFVIDLLYSRPPAPASWG